MVSDWWDWRATPRSHWRDISAAAYLAVRAVSHTRSLRAAVDAKEKELADTVREWTEDRARMADALEKAQNDARVQRERAGAIEASLKAEKAESARLGATVKSQESE